MIIKENIPELSPQICLWIRSFELYIYMNTSQIYIVLSFIVFTFCIRLYVSQDCYGPYTDFTVF